MRELFTEHLLSAIVFLPAVLALPLLFMPKQSLLAARVYALLASTAVFVLSMGLYTGFRLGTAEMQFAENLDWLPAVGIRYAIGLDGISLFLVLLTTLLVPLIVLSAWHAVEERVRSYFFFLLLLESAILGAFVALDLFLFYIFWEAMLVPMFFLIGVWGGKDRIYAATKFLLYTAAGSAPMLVAIIYLVFQHKTQFGAYSALITDLYRLSLPGAGFTGAASLVFLAFALAFAVKVPLFPLHTWLPDAHVQAPTGGSVILAGVLLKLGGYGLMRFAMPLAANVLPLYAPYFMWVAAIAIVYGACVAVAQDDVKKLVAYSSVSHMGYVILGLFAMNMVGITGSVYQMLNHGVSTGALFLLVGVLYERTHTREIKAYSGLAKSLPIFSIIMLIMTFSSIALPGTNGFIGEFMILQGSFLASPWVTAVAGLGVILGAVYMLWLCQRILFGKPETTGSDKLADIKPREFAYLLPLIALVFFMGLYPKVFFDRMEPSLKAFAERIQPGKIKTAQLTLTELTHADHN